MAVEAGEPGILLIVGGAGLAGQIATPELQRAPAGAVADHVAHHGVHDPNVLRRERARRARLGAHAALLADAVGDPRRRGHLGILSAALADLPGRRGGRILHHAAVLADLRRRAAKEHGTVGGLDAGDEVGLDQVAAVGERGVAGGELERRDAATAECEGEIPRQALDVQTETTQVIHRVVDADVAQQADGDEVARVGQRHPQPRGAVELAAVVLRAPHGLEARIVEHHRRVVDDARRRIAAVDRGGVDEGLEARARLALGLHGAIELAAIEIEAAGQRDHRAVLRV